MTAARGRLRRDRHICTIIRSYDSELTMRRRVAKITIREIHRVVFCTVRSDRKSQKSIRRATDARRACPDRIPINSDRVCARDVNRIIGRRFPLRGNGSLVHRHIVNAIRPKGKTRRIPGIRNMDPVIRAGCNKEMQDRETAKPRLPIRHEPAPIVGTRGRNALTIRRRNTRYE